MEIWTEVPTKEAVLEKIYQFFALLSQNNIEEAKKFVKFQNDFNELLKGLWEDIEDWHEDFEDADFNGTWLTNLMPPDKVEYKDLLGIDWLYGKDDAEYNGEHIALNGEDVLITVCFLKEPTDDTADFSINKVNDGYELELKNIHIM